ncbi:MAG: glycosyltransferase family 9 protein [Hyphomicrobiales bacterium]|nr:glycosyltransferase family 9 protein [Hyphomicrobiales bacterium]
MSKIVLRPGARILVITLRRLGDVLLTTPLIRSLKQGVEGSSVAALVFRGTEGVLVGNADLDEVIVMPHRPTGVEMAALIRRLWRRYDLAVPTQVGDRPIFFAWIAGRQRLGFVPEQPGPARWWKANVLQQALPAAPTNHRVLELLRLVQPLGLEACTEVVCPAGPASTRWMPTGRYAVLHPNPMHRVRRWTDAGWRALAAALTARGLAVVTTGGADPAERTYLDQVWQQSGSMVARLDGCLDWPSLAQVLRGAAVYVGPDTSVTHLAAAAGCPTVALFGPVSPSLIGPWPVGGLDTVWRRAAAIQRKGNVWIVQNPLPCMPCDRLGCEGHLESYSRCLDEMSVQSVLRAVDEALHR